MVAGGLSINVAKNDSNIVITSPTIIEDNTMLLTYEKALHVAVELEKVGEMEIYFILADRKG
ncbi:hypothetical protein ACFQ3N_01265 [Virgibacillus byunsanensis]|uniref:Uncharacterized protein n=1 Tax=Virgibacillus byunsanensis TaxID=570945 RepID=A0ABW3LF95_9BACI